MAYAHDESEVGGQPPVQVHRVGGWKLLAGAMLAAAGLGFAGFVYAVPYQKAMHVLNARTNELGKERAGIDDLIAERDALKADLTRRETADQDKATAASSKQQAVAAFVAEMKAALDALGATTSVADGRADVSFAVASLFEQPTSTVISPQGDAALKVLGAAVKKAGFRVRAKAKLIPAPPPRSLAQLQNIGEFAMLRSVRAMLALANAGVAPDKVATVGEAPSAGARKAKPGIPDRLDIEIEPE
jgi:hypothetical protein